MSRYLEGKPLPFRSLSDRKEMIGKRITYLCHADIDRSGRGYFFPRYDKVIDAKGIYLILETGNAISRSDIVEIAITGETP